MLESTLSLTRPRARGLGVAGDAALLVSRSVERGFRTTFFFRLRFPAVGFAA